MSEAETMIAPTWRARLADPKPAFCTGCLRGADAQTVFVEFASISSGRGQLREFGSMAVVADLDRFALCQSARWPSASRSGRTCTRRSAINYRS